MDTAETSEPLAPTDPQGPQRRRWRLRTAIISTATALALVLGGAAAWAADRFLIPKVEISDVAQYEASQTATGANVDATDDDTSVTVTQETRGTGEDTITLTIADVQLGDATDLRSAFAHNQFGENITQTTSEMAEANDAVFAVNGDYYGFRSTGIVIRNGVAYRDEPAREGLAMYTDGRVEVYDETSTSADELVAAGVWNTLSFGPAIVEDGQAVDGIEDVEIDTNFGNHSIQGQQPRTAIGVIDENHLVFVVVDGRDPGTSRGATLTELADIMLELGAETAYNLDGGGSSTLYSDGGVVNRPSNGGERGTSDILYVAG
ncbi:phosphodiester glycosidase family protein [Leucobacter rhizosphaerae]|uniref:Phosphodiester glycosidase family protein n=1 Tax=Leucobacter rhizosphaerae TaxID=2932245 RepID=A0ABY4FX13_9MICO|nr:phosphodiester glycosidase family protein [Leucobacter rhizosphaerae]UOQ60803.1 phosphodiester glycosidase family protein [Leucobacter rhizosphaerae]